MNTNTQDKAIHSSVLDVAHHLAEGNDVAVACVEPGNGGRYVMVITRLLSGQAKVVGNRFLFALPDWRRCYPISLPGYFAPSYVAEKLTNDNTADAEVVAAFLNALSAEMREDG